MVVLNRSEEKSGMCQLGWDGGRKQKCMCVSIYTYKYAYRKQTNIKINEQWSQTLIRGEGKVCAEKL